VFKLFWNIIRNTNAITNTITNTNKYNLSSSQVPNNESTEQTKCYQDFKEDYKCDGYNCVMVHHE
jgi:hypothetical protein